MTDAARDTVVVGPEPLTLFCTGVFEHAGMDSRAARTQADVLIWANLHGVDSHGVLRIPKYRRWLASGVMNPRPNLRIDDKSAVTFVLEADRAPGGVAMQAATQHAIGRARESGLAWGIVRETTHTGPMGYYASQMARRDLLGIAFASSRPNMAYFGARQAGVATSPIALAAPGERVDLLMLDMATAEIAIGKILKARATGDPLPDGAALNVDGEPTNDPHEAVLPMPLAGPKGSGLALMLECFQGVLVDHPLLAPAIRRGAAGHSQNGLVAAIDIGRFGDAAGYRRRIDDLAAAIRSLPAADGVERILLPGEFELRTAEDRRRTGIPLPAKTWNALLDTAMEVGVEPPPVRYQR